MSKQEVDSGSHVPAEFDQLFWRRLDVPLNLGSAPCWPARGLILAAKRGRGRHPRRAGATVKQGPADQQEPRSPPAEIEGGAQLALVGSRHVLIVEVADDGVRRPADRDQVEEAGQAEEGSGDAADSGLGVLPAQALGALDSQDGQAERHTAQQDGENSETPGRLHVTGQCQHAVVHLALDLARALHDARHPQALPYDLSHHDVVADEGCDPPQGGSAGQGSAHPAQQGHDEAEQLQARGRH